MANSIPAGFTELGKVLEKKDVIVDVMGVVVDYMSAKPSRGTDWTCVFSIADVSSRTEGVRVRFFAPQVNMPNIQGLGDIVILRGVKSTFFQGSELLISNFGTAWVIFPWEKIPTERPEGSLKLDYFVSKSKSNLSKSPSNEEMTYALELYDLQLSGSMKQVMNASHDLPNLSSTNGFRAREKFSLLKGVKANTFYDLLGQVVKAFAIGDRHELYITDYTENQCFYNYLPEGDGHATVSKDGDEYGYVSTSSRRKWLGPWGQQTMTVTLFPPHANYAVGTIKVGDIVRLKNVHVKLGREGIARLEGVLHSDKKYPERVDVSVITAKEDERAKDILRRKKAYEKDVLADGSTTDIRVHKRKIDDNPTSKPYKRTKREYEKPQIGFSVYAQGMEEPRANKPIKYSTPSLKDRSLSHSALAELNKHIKAIKAERINTPISSILSPIDTHSWTTPNQQPCILPFQNVCYRSCVRVIDFKPDRLEDFAIKCRVSEYDELSDCEGSIDEDNVSVASEGSPYSEPSQSLDDGSCFGESTPRQKHKWTWRFALLLEDATSAASKNESDRVVVYVTDEDADYLLNMEACNLRRCPNALSSLREKLFILWGELEERKASGGFGRAIAEINNNGAIASDQGEDKFLILKSNALEKDKFVPAGEFTKAFQCCLMEYGVKVKSKWQRRFRMFGTTIQ